MLCVDVFEFAAVCDILCWLKIWGRSKQVRGGVSKVISSQVNGVTISKQTQD